MPAIERVPVLDELLVLAATEYPTEPFPDPLAPDVIVIQPAPEDAVQAQPAPEVTATLPLLAEEFTFEDVGEMLYEHAPLSVNVNALLSVALRPSVFQTVTSTAPTGWAGLVAVMRLALLTTTCVADDPPKLTLAPVAKFDPLIATDVPPPSSPVVGLSDVTVGVPAPLIGQTMPPIPARVLPQGARPPATFCVPCSL